MGSVLHFTDGTFDEQVLQGKGTVVVDFYSDWCAPCRLLEPAIEELAAEYGDDVKVGRLDVSANPATAIRYSVMAIPTVMIFRDGEQADVQVGLVPKDVLKAKIDAVARVE